MLEVANFKLRTAALWRTSQFATVMDSETNSL